MPSSAVPNQYKINNYFQLYYKIGQTRSQIDNQL